MQNVTLCITAGGRPDLLRETLQSLLPYNSAFFADIFVTNDRGDEETNEVIRDMIPSCRLFNHPIPVGQHLSIDEMYECVKTDYIFHCEDDWYFDPIPFIPTMLSALIELDNVSSVSARQSSSLRSHDGRVRKFGNTVPVTGGFARRLEEDTWFGHSFNPAMLRTSLWREVGPFSRYANEESVNEAIQNTGLSRAFLVPGIYYHIGDGRHMPNVTELPQSEIESIMEASEIAAPVKKKRFNWLNR